MATHDHCQLSKGKPYWEDQHGKHPWEKKCQQAYRLTLNQGRMAIGAWMICFSRLLSNQKGWTMFVFFFALFLCIARHRPHDPSWHIGLFQNGCSRWFSYRKKPNGKNSHCIATIQKDRYSCLPVGVVVWGWVVPWWGLGLWKVERGNELNIGYTYGCTQSKKFATPRIRSAYATHSRHVVSGKHIPQMCKQRR